MEVARGATLQEGAVKVSWCRHVDREVYSKSLVREERGKKVGRKVYRTCREGNKLVEKKSVLREYDENDYVDLG